jgi:polysaccharide pyruvyl transferase WcaK-like protein
MIFIKALQKSFDYESKKSADSYEPIHIGGLSFFVGLANFDQIQELTEKDSNCIMVVNLRKSNIFEFTPDIIERFKIIFTLVDVPDDYSEKFHLFSLIQKLISLNRYPEIRAYLLSLSSFVSSNRTNALLPKPLDFNLLKIRFNIINQIFERVLKKVSYYELKSKIYSSFYGKIHGILKGQNHNITKKRVLITGWYGTETAGDKAILLELISQLKIQFENPEIIITSIVPELSYLTNFELNLQLGVIELKNVNYSKLRDIDYIIFGGGPLMDSTQLNYIVSLFNYAALAKCKSILFGCGVGPIIKGVTKVQISKILDNSNIAFFRDTESLTLAIKLGYKGERLVACDPAFNFVHQFYTSNKISSTKIVTLLRKQTKEYSNNYLVENDFINQNVDYYFKSNLSSEEIVVLSMHMFWLGNDDRTMNSEIEAKHNLTKMPLVYDLFQLINHIQSSNMGVAMRYHGHIFLLASCIPFVSIDYTGEKGKISNLINRYGLDKYSIKISEMSDETILNKKIDELKSDYTAVKEGIKSKIQKDLDQLNNVYKRIW